ncbi:sensor domain-containing protein [Psychromonas hadalis]|uniref:sensor domain-containing protein n=1 Tax=Psychromonas hadalis TaxID=211669 RepID=UPI0003B3E9F7|nr:EAL domain-containing protein [Psychromonas hadalis]
MSLLVKNVLYIGRNVELVEALLTSLTDGNKKVSYNTKYMLCSNEILAVLAEKNYHYLIIEQSIPKVVSERIHALFPQLRTTYLNSAQPINEKLIPPSAKQLVSEDVKKALNCISIPIYYKNKKGIILVCNTSFAKHLGLTCDEVIGQYAFDVLPDSLKEGLEIVDKMMFDDHQVHLYECELHDLDGRRHEVVFRKELIAGTDIQIGMVFDVSELNKARRSVEKERMMLRATADISPDLIFFKDLKSRFLGCNKQFEKFIGESEKKILGKTDDQFFELEQALMCQQQDQDVMVNNEIYSGEEHLTYIDGERHFIDMRKVPLLDKKGNVQGLIGIGRDITAQHRLQKRLKVANAVFENSQENIIVTDQSRIIISANLATCQLTGYKKSELLGNAVDMLSTQEPNSTLHQKIEEALENNKQWKGDITYRNKQQEIRFAWLDVYVVELEEGVNNRIYSFTDLSQNKNIESKIQFLSKHDPLTGLANRIALFTKLEDAINRANFNEVAMAVILVDINGFKAVNDQYGHNAGDKVLQEIARRLKNCIFEKDTVARFGDDEFVIIVDGLKNEHDAALVAQKVAEQFSYKFKIGDIEASLNATIGISLCPDDGVDVDTLLQSAEKAMLRAKGDKSVSYHFYTDQLTKHSSSQLQLEKEMKIALQEDQFDLYYQPQYDINKKLIVAMESVLRWHHPKHGLLLPDRFLSLAEESGLLIPIGLKMLKKAALQTVKWKKSNINFGRIAVNLSTIQLEQISLIADIQTVIKETGCSSKDLEFEIAEATFESENHTLHENLLNIHKLGIAITVDGFGADIPIFHFIESLGIDKFKVSKNYIQNIPGRLVGEAMIKSVIVLARELGIDVVGESIESTEQAFFSSTNNMGHHPVNPMKVSEATFYLRCHKKK